MTNWDGKVHSLLRPLKRCCHVNPAVLPEATDPDWEFDYIDIGSVSLSEGVTRKERMRFSASPSRARKPVSEGDVLVATVRTYLKAIAAIQESDAPQVASTGFAVLRASEETEPRFLYRIVQSNPFVEQVVAQSVGVSYPAINPSTLSNIKIPLPDIETQTAIADFLDRETARIDRLIEKKQRLVELAEEKRSATITAAVTGQTDPETGERQSLSRRASEGGGGLNTTPLRHLATVMNSNVDKLSALDEVPVRLCNYVDVYRNDRITVDMAFMSATATPAEIARFGLRVGDVIITKDSEDRTDIAVPAYVSDTAPDIVCGYHLAILRARPALARGDFLFWAIQSKQAREAFSNAAGGVTRFGLTLDGVKSVCLPHPDLMTQRAIADFLDRETALLDTIKKQTLASIDRLKEYRSALITAAVTGQIDVATWRKPGCTERHLDQVGEEIPA